MTHLKTPNLLLDTTVFDAANYSYATGALKALLELAAADKVRVYISEITLREIKSHLSKAVSDAVRAQREFEKRARILRNSTIPLAQVAFRKFDAHALESELLSQLEDFLKNAKVTVLAVTDIKLGNVLDAYFDKKPPFGAGKNKAEFPDAFTLGAARDWANKNNQSIYIVSADSAVQSACDNNQLLPLDKLSNLLNLVAQEDEAQAQFIHEKVREQFDEIEEQIKKDFEAQGFMVSDKEGDVNQVRVTRIDVDDLNILSFSKDSAEVEIELRIYFEADISYADLDNAIYDHEEGRYLLWDTVEKTVQSEETVFVTATVLVRPGDPDYFKFDSVRISGQDTYSVTADDEWPYK